MFGNGLKTVLWLFFVSGEDFSDNEHDNLVDELEPAEHLGEPEHIFQDLHMSRMSYEDLVKKSVVCAYNNHTNDFWKIRSLNYIIGSSN